VDHLASPAVAGFSVSKIRGQGPPARGRWTHRAGCPDRPAGPTGRLSPPGERRAARRAVAAKEFGLSDVPW